MAIAVWICVMGIVWQDPEPATAIVARLTSARLADREAAVRELQSRGEAARNALEEAADSFDLELRAQAAMLLDRLDGQGLTQPTRLRLELENATPLESAAAITKQTGVTIRLDPEDDPRWSAGLVTIHGEMTLWEAVDRLAADSGASLVSPSGSIRRPANFAGRDGRRPSATPQLTLKADSSPPPPLDHSGAFRATVLGLRLRQVRNFAQRPGGLGPLPPIDEFTVQIQLRGEPRLSLASIDDVVIQEAIDDRGQSLLPVATIRPSAPATPSTDGMARNGSFTVALAYPKTPGQTITRLSGHVKGLIVGRRDNPLIVSLSSKNLPVSRDGASLTVEDVRLVQNGQIAIVRIKLEGVDTAPGTPPGHGRFDPRSSLKPPPGARGHLDFFDGQGRLCQSVDLGQMPGGLSVGNVVTMSVHPPSGVGPPVEARYHAASWTLAEIPFEFHDIPMP